MPQIRDAVVVIAGASSGIGRAAAQLFARHGARLVLAGRSRETLDPVVAECTRLGADAIAVRTDVSDAAAVQRLAWAATGRFGRVDVWINNAGVGAVGPFEEVPLASHEQVVRTNLIGTMNGAHAVLPIFKRQGRGVMINTLSVGSWAPTPFAASYAASKFGLRGFTESLRAELVGHPRIRVCDIFPGIVDSPGLRHGANYSGRRLEPRGALSPFHVAETMLSLVRSPRNVTAVGLAARAQQLAYRAAPGPVRWAMGQLMRRGLGQAPRAALSDGNLFQPPQDHGIYGGFANDRDPPRIPTAAWMTAAGIVGFWLARR